MKSIENKKIIQIKNFRELGYSIPEISRKLSLSKSTIFRYVQNVEILPENIQRWEERRNASKIISQRDWVIASEYAKNLLFSLENRDLAILGAALYWAEGAKRDFSFTNSDPDMIKVFLYSLHRLFGIKDEDIKISIRIYEDLDKEECINFWSGVTGIPLENNASINILHGSKKGKLKYGMCRVRVRKAGLLLKKLISVNKQFVNLIQA